MEERIYSAAIWYKDLKVINQRNPVNITGGIVVKGHRHADIIWTVYTLLGKRTCLMGENSSGESIQGFVTNKDRFVDREEAYEIAYKANQLGLEYADREFGTLYSEDLY
jgi:hypothetical protein